MTPMTGPSAEENGLNIPERFLSGFQWIATRDENAMTHLLTALQHQPATLAGAALVKRLTDELAFDDEEVEEIIDALFVAHSVRASLEWSVPQISASIAADNSLEIDEASRVRLASRLESLLPLPAIEVAAKALAVLYEHERFLCNVRIVTDVRPIFSDDAKALPLATVIVHNLRISYHEGHGLRHFFVALDGLDLEDLRKIIDRALDKEATLAHMSASTGIENIRITSQGEASLNNEGFT